MASRVPLLTMDDAKKFDRLVDDFFYEATVSGSPDEALKNIAVVNNLLPDQIRMLARAYNGGMTNYYLRGLKSASGLANLKICNPEDVIKQLYGDDIESRVTKSASVSLDYLKSPSDLGLWNYTPKIVPVEKVEERGIYSKQKELRALVNYSLTKTAELKLAVHQWMETLDATLGRLNAYFKSQDAIDPREVATNCRMWKIPTATLFKFAGVGVDPKKLYRTNAPVSWEEPPYCLIKMAYYAIERFREAYSRYIKTACEVEACLPSAPEKRQKRAAFFDGPIATAIGKYMTKGAYKDKPKPAGGGSGQSQRNQRRDGGGESKGGKGGGGRQDDKKEKALKFNLSPPGEVGKLSKKVVSLTGKAFENISDVSWMEDALKDENTLEMKIFLTHLLQEDEVISQYEPEQVLAAYKNIIRLSPHLPVLPDMLRTVLRKVLAAGALEPVDVEMLVKTEQRLGKRIINPEKFYESEPQDQR